MTHRRYDPTPEDVSVFELPPKKERCNGRLRVTQTAASITQNEMPKTAFDLGFGRYQRHR